MSFHIVIPARYASTRLPAKPLLDLAGKAMIVRVYEQVVNAKGAKSITVATDHPEVYQCCVSQHIPVLMTAATHPSGTDRLAEVAQLLSLGPDEIVVNVQGDEPLMPCDYIEQVAEALGKESSYPLNAQAAIATLACPIVEVDDYYNPNVVKVVCRGDQRALYFSRAMIPYARDACAKLNPSGLTQNKLLDLPPDLPLLRHIGIYAYRVKFLSDYQNLSSVSLEQFEALEQLRALYYGYDISVAIVPTLPHPGVDTPEDAKRMQEYFEFIRGAVNK